jgi:hypothetical protein
MEMLKRKLSLILLGVVLAASTSIVNAGIAVNFPGDLSVSGLLGAPGYEQGNWLNTINQPDSWGTTYNLRDDSNDLTGAVLSVWSSGFGAQETYVNTDFPMPSRMLETAIGSWAASDPPTFTVTNIPYGEYDVIVYFGCRRSYDFVQEVIVNGTSLFGRIPAGTGYTEMGYRQVPSTSVSDQSEATPYGNYMVFKGVSGSTLTVSALPGWHSAEGDARAYISGFQIIPVYKQAMAVNFPAQMPPITGVQGAPGFEQDNWLNTINQEDSWGITYNLQDESGTATGAVLAFWASATAQQGNINPVDFPMQSWLLETGIWGYLASDAPRLRVDNIPYAQYSVVVYFGASQDYDTVQEVIVNGNSLFGRVPYYTRYIEMGYRNIPSTSTADLQANTPYGNYMVFENVTGSTLNITALPGWYSTVHPRAFISGFQIIDGGPIAPKYEEAMAVNFPSNSGWTVSGTAGAPGYAQANWVNTDSNQSSWGATYDLIDNNGLPTGAKMDWYASEIGSWHYGTAANDNERMMDAGIASVDGLVEVHVVDIPYAKYDVIVYFSAQLTNAFVSKYTIGSTSVYAQIPAMGYFANDNTFIQVPSSSIADQNENTPAGNYIIFKDVTGSTLYLTAQSGWAGTNIYNYQPGYTRSCISGFQIINTCNGPLAGDITNDCAVNLLDIELLASNWLKYVDEFSDARSECAKNPLIYAPQIPAITVNGDFSDWASASDWAVFGKWYEGGLDSTTQAKYAWNDASNKLYIGIESTETTSLILEVGGLMGDLSDANAMPSGGIQATQLEFSGWSGGVPTSIINQSEGTVSGIQAAYTVSGGTIKIEIAMPIYSDWKNIASGINLTNQMDIYAYADIFSDDWFTMGDNQCADGAYYYSYGTPTMQTGSLVRLMQSFPRTCADVPNVYKNGLIDINDDCIVNLVDFANVAVDWLLE